MAGKLKRKGDFMNVCHFIGNLTRDPEVKTLASGTKVTSFGIALNSKYKKGDEWVNDTTFLDMEAWSNTAEFVEKYFKKGDSILVHCAAKTDSWDDKTSGQKRSKTKFKVDRVEFVPGGKKRKSENQLAEESGGSESDMVSDVSSDSDIPF